MPRFSRMRVAIVESPGQYFRVWEAAPGVVLSLSVGRAGTDGARACIEVLEDVLECYGTLFVATDASRLVGYDPNVRELYTAWYAAHRSAMTGMHIVLSSGMLKMAVQLTNSDVGGFFTQHFEREPFERAVLAEAPGLDLSPFQTFQAVRAPGA